MLINAIGVYSYTVAPNRTDSVQYHFIDDRVDRNDFFKQSRLLNPKRMTALHLRFGFGVAIGGRSKLSSI